MSTLKKSTLAMFRNVVKTSSDKELDKLVKEEKKFAVDVRERLQRYLPKIKEHVQLNISVNGGVYIGVFLVNNIEDSIPGLSEELTMARKKRASFDERRDALYKLRDEMGYYSPANAAKFLIEHSHTGVLLLQELQDLVKGLAQEEMKKLEATTTKT